MKSLFVFALLVAPALGQYQQNFGFKLDNGAEVAYQVWGELPGANSNQVTQAGNVVHRNLLAADGKPWLGFEVHIEREGSDFQISFQPAGGFPYFPKSPAGRRVHDGDRVLMDVLEQPGTGKKVFDTFQVHLPGTPSELLPLPRQSAPGVIPASAILHLGHPVLSPMGMGSLFKNSTSAAGVFSGTSVQFDAPTVGHFTFSSEPAPGYRLEALAEGNEIRFLAGNSTYSVTSDAPIVNIPGAWLLWVHTDSLAAPPSPTVTEGPCPLEVTDAPASANPSPGFHLQVRNISATHSILAYTLAIRYIDPDTNKAGMGGSHGAIFMNQDGTPRPLAPGQKSTADNRSTNKSASGKPLVPKVTVDLVVFEDGSIWGPAQTEGAKRQLVTIQTFKSGKQE